MKILIIGAKSQLGKSLIQSRPSLLNGSKIELIELSRQDIDLVNIEKLKSLLIKIKPNWIINTAAFTSVDAAETNSEMAFQINALVPKAICDLLVSIGGNLLQISTDYVFDGNQGFAYNPLQKRNPLSVYGSTKAAAEEFIEDILFPANQAIIIRTSWLVNHFGNNFVLKMIDLMNKNDQIKVVADQIGCISHTDQLAKIIWSIIDLRNSNKNLSKILHWSDSGVVSWFDIAIAIADISKNIGIHNNPARIIPTSSRLFNSLAKRPCFSLLDSNKTVTSYF